MTIAISWSEQRQVHTVPYSYQNFAIHPADKRPLPEFYGCQCVWGLFLRRAVALAWSTRRMTMADGGTVLVGEIWTNWQRLSWPRGKDTLPL
jgi:hypothetical protein